jgi:serine/threonine-protein kinase
MAELGVWTIPGYVVHERLQAGLVSAAYLASRTSDGYPVLLQVVSEEFSDPVSAEHFRTTIEQLTAVRHPVIPTVSEVGEADGLLYTISGAVEGRSLDATLRSMGALPMDDTLAVCTELADALDMLAAAGVVHGAISPTTVWINDRVRSPSAPYVSLRGFGTTPLRARRIQDPDIPPPPDIAYTAPEQVHGSAPVVGTDQYALACMVLHCLTGALPFERATIDDLFDAHLAREPDDALLQADRLPGRVVTGLRRALSKDPADRFDSCAEFATAIGATARPSWTWMIEDGQPGGAADEIDIRDGVTGARSTAPGSGSPTARSLSEVDWLPGSATRTGPSPQRVRAPATAPAGRGPNPVAAPRRRRLSARHTRWIGLAVLALLVAASTVVLVRAVLAADPTGAAAGAGDQSTGGAPEIAASWREPIADGPVDLLAAQDDGVLSVTGAVVDRLDHDTGRSQWRTELDEPVRELSVLGPTVILRTASQFVALDHTDGDVLWRSSETDMPPLDAFITGRGRMFGAARDDAGDVAVHAIDPSSGAVSWSITTPPADEGGGGSDDSDPLIAFDGSERGQRSLYVVDGDTLSAFSVTTQQLRWQITLDGARPVSMTALAGAVLTVSEDGEVCRYHADDGEAAWTTCATLERTDDPGTIAQVRDSRVIVTGEHEVLSVDFTSGTPRWRIISDEALQPVMAANRAATYVAAPDGTVEAIAQRNGASLWKSAPFGPISAMSASDDAVYLTTSDGRLTRLEASAGPDDDA